MNFFLSYLLLIEEAVARMAGAEQVVDILFETDDNSRCVCFFKNKTYPTIKYRSVMEISPMPRVSPLGFAQRIPRV